MRKCDWKRVGDLTHVAIILNAAVFAYVVVWHNNHIIFDPSWRIDGFCITNKEVPYWSSHDLCLYVDTAASVIVAILFFSLKKSPCMEPANEFIGPSILGIFAHGIAHGMMANHFREKGKISEDGAASSSNENRTLAGFAGLMFFWVFLLKNTMPNVSKKVLIPFAAACSTGNIYVSPQFAFTFVQTVLLVTFSVNQLLRPLMEKDFAYGIYPVFSGLPLTFIGWLESTSCSRTPICNIGGHLVYDAWIPVSLISFYLTFYWTRVSETKVKSA